MIPFPCQLGSIFTPKITPKTYKNPPKPDPRRHPENDCSRDRVLEPPRQPKTAPRRHPKGFQNRVKTHVRYEQKFTCFLKLFWSRWGAVLGGPDPPDSIIPGEPFSMLWPTLVLEAAGPGFYQIFWGNLGRFWRIFLGRLEQIFESILAYIFCNIFASRFVYDGLKSPRPHNVFHIFWNILATAFLLKAFSRKLDSKFMQTLF